MLELGAGAGAGDVVQAYGFTARCTTLASSGLCRLISAAEGSSDIKTTYWPNSPNLLRIVQDPALADEPLSSSLRVPRKNRSYLVLDIPYYSVGEDEDLKALCLLRVLDGDVHKRR